MNSRLTELKNEIDGIGNQVIELLNKKFSLLQEVAELKEKEGVPITNRFAEESLMDSIDKNPDIKFKKSIKEVMKTCNDQAKKIQGQYIFGEENIWLIGMPGCGKSTVGKYIAEYMCKDYFDADVFFTSVFGMRPDICINSMGVDFFRDSETKVLGMLAQKKGAVIACGGGVVERKDNFDILKSNNAKVIYVKRDLKKLATNGRPISASVGVEALYERRHTAYEEWSDLQVKNDVIDDCVKEVYNYFLTEKK